MKLEGAVATWEKPGTPGAVHNDHRSCHEWFASLTIDRSKHVS